jgi:hypothetical protein
METSTTTEITPDPGTLEIATDQEERELLADVDAIFQGDLPFGALFGLDADDIHAFADLADDLLAAGRVRGPPPAAPGGGPPTPWCSTRGACCWTRWT